MRRLVPIALGLVVFCAGASASAQNKKFQLGLRSGYALPFGDAWSAGRSGIFTFPADVHMKDAISGMIPIWLDAGYMVTPEILVGAYLQYGFLSVKQREITGGVGCAANASCSGQDLRFGAQLQYHFSAGQSLDPWLGAGIGYEWLMLKTEANGTTSNATLSGFEFANLQGGLDLLVTEGFTLGPFVSFSFGQYSNVHVETGGLGIDLDVPSAMHEWLTFGVKGTLGL